MSQILKITKVAMADKTLTVPRNAASTPETLPLITGAALAIQSAVKASITGSKYKRPLASPFPFKSTQSSQDFGRDLPILSGSGLTPSLSAVFWKIRNPLLMDLSGCVQPLHADVGSQCNKQ